MSNLWKTITALLAVGVLVLWAFSSGFFSPRATVSRPEGAIQAVVYKSPSCGCCGNYVSYLRRNEIDVEVQQMQDVTPVKQRVKVPQELSSCHTSIIGSYVVEGHIPVEAIYKLLTEKPAIAGIALAGMPSGSPGMPGAKEPFEIHSITPSGQDGGIFMEL